MRDFNTAGPIIAEDHYHIPPLERLDLDELLRLIERKRYFVLHAPRQTGKTTALFALMERLNDGGRYRCVYINVEIGQSAREDVGAAMRAILRSLAQNEESALGTTHLRDIWPEALDAAGPHGALQESLARWAEAEDKPLVLFIDEVDALVGDTLIAALRQLRAGYPERPGRFPHSIGLCGVRDVRDYRIWSSAENAVVLGGSAFNIKTRSLRLGDFSEAQTHALLRQHTDATGQQFHDEALDEVWCRTRGQPWLVNALADEACFRSETGRDRRQPITQDAIRDAAEQLVQRRETHLDQLARQLEDERVRRVIEPLLCGDATIERIAADDIEYVRDLGLVGRDDPVAIANPIYREVVPRQLTHAAQAMLPLDAPWYVGPDGQLRMDDLMRAFQDFFRQHSAHWIERFQYREAGPQLLLQAFLQRIVNSRGRIEREYGVGRGRTDLTIFWPATPGSPERRIVIECKLIRGSREHTLREATSQISAYMDACNADEGHLALFDRDPDKPWREKIFREERQVAAGAVVAWGM